MRPKKLAFSNGLRVLLIPQYQSPSVTALILVEAGSEYEYKEINGISHFLEHMAFKGTKNRPSARHISEELDGLGAEYNAFTGQEYTGYWAKAHRDKFEKILEVVADLYLNPLFKEEDIEKERGVIIEEINMYEDTPIRKVHDIFTALLYGDQPAGWDIAGTKSVIRKLTRKDLLEYRQRRYCAKSTLIVIAGGFSSDLAVEMVFKMFHGISKAKPAPKPKTIEIQTKPKLALKAKKLEQTHLVIGVRAFNLFSPKRFILRVLANVLAGGMSSRLFQKIREEKGAAYYINGEVDLYLDHGYLAVSAGVDNQRVSEVIASILDEFRRLKNKLISSAELNKAKDNLVGRLYLSMETSDELANFYGLQEILCRQFLTPAEIEKNIRKVKAEEIREVAREIFVSQKLNLALIGPHKNSLPFKKILYL